MSNLPDAIYFLAVEDGGSVKPSPQGLGLICNHSKPMKWATDFDDLKLHLSQSLIALIINCNAPSPCGLGFMLVTRFTGDNPKSRNMSE